jgi:hypothetical protein
MQNYSLSIINIGDLGIWEDRDEDGERKKNLNFREQI